MSVSKQTFEFLGLEYQERLLAQILKDRAFAEGIVRFLKPNYFTNETLKLLSQEYVRAYDKDGVLLDSSALKIRLFETIQKEEMRDTVDAYLDKIQKTPSIDWENVQKQAFKFCKQQEVLRVVGELQELVKKSKLDDSDIDKYIQYMGSIGGIGKKEAIISATWDDLDVLLSDEYRNPIPTGITKLDSVMNGGLSGGELAIILAALGVGKAQPLTSKIHTPNGWKTMGDMEIGTEVTKPNGGIAKVIGVYPQGIRPIYEVIFSDGTKTECDENHLWAVNQYSDRRRGNNEFVVKSLKEIKDSLVIYNSIRNYRIPIVDGVGFECDTDLPIDPYLLGLILGDGCITEHNQPHIVTKDEELISKIKNCYDGDVSVSDHERVVKTKKGLVTRSLIKVSLLGIKEKLATIGLYDTNSKTKFIPEMYINNSLEVRLALLQGLMDSDDYSNKHRCEFSSISKNLSDGVKDIVLSLGGRVKTIERFGKVNGVKKEKYFRVSFSMSDKGFIPFRLQRKIDSFKPRTKYTNNKYITEINYLRDDYTQCIMLDSEDHLYITDDYIVTHNTTIATKIANTAFNMGKNVLQIFFEDSQNAIRRKHIACWTGIEINKLNQHKEEVKQVIEKKTSSSGGNLFLVKMQSIETTMTKIRDVVKKLKDDGFDIDVMLIDYIDCVQPSRNYADPLIAEGMIMREYENLLDEYQIAGYAMTQGNRSAIGSKVVDTDQMGGSIKKAQIGHFILSIARPIEQKKEGKATMGILKSRFGADGIIFDNVIFNNANLHIEILPNTDGSDEIKVSARHSEDITVEQKVTEVMARMAKMHK